MCGDTDGESQLHEHAHFRTTAQILTSPTCSYDIGKHLLVSLDEDVTSASTGVWPR